MYLVVIISLVLCISTAVRSQDACTTAQLAVDSNSVCQQTLQTLAMSNYNIMVLELIQVVQCVWIHVTAWLLMWLITVQIL